MLNKRSTEAEVAGTPKTFFAVSANIGNVFSCVFQNSRGHWIVFTLLGILS